MPNKKAPVKKNNQSVSAGKKSKTWLWLIFGCLGLFIIAIVVALILFVMVFKLFAGPADLANEQLRLIRENKLNQAYDDGSNEFKKATSYNDFVQFVLDHPELAKNKKVSFDHTNIQGSSATLHGTIQSSDSTQIPVVYRMVKENGRWKVYYFTINPTGEIEAPQD